MTFHFPSFILYTVALAFCSRIPVPRFFATICFGNRSTRYRASPIAKEKSTRVIRSGSAKSLRIASVLRTSPLGSPYKAYTIASSIDVLPAPVGPEMRNIEWA